MRSAARWVLYIAASLCVNWVAPSCRDASVVCLRLFSIASVCVHRLHATSQRRSASIGLPPVGPRRFRCLSASLSPLHLCVHRLICIRLPYLHRLCLYVPFFRASVCASPDLHPYLHRLCVCVSFSIASVCASSACYIAASLCVNWVAPSWAAALPLSVCVSFSIASVCASPDLHPTAVPARTLRIA